MSFADLREFISFLEDKGELRRIKTAVSPELEITELADRAVKSGGPAMLFENVQGHEMPVAINLFGTKQRMAWALGVDDLDDLADQVRKILGMVQDPPTGLLDKLRAAGDLVGLARAQPKTVSIGLCQEVVITGEDVDLNELPALKCWPEDAGRFITLPLVISKDPKSGPTQRGDLPDAGLRRPDHRDALADPQGRRSSLQDGGGAETGADGRGRSAGRGPRDNVVRLSPTAAGHGRDRCIGGNQG